MSTPEGFEVGDRVMMDSGRRWHGEILAVSSAYPRVQMVTVRWDNRRTQDVNTFMMDLVLEEPS